MRTCLTEPNTEPDSLVCIRTSLENSMILISVLVIKIQDKDKRSDILWCLLLWLQGYLLIHHFGPVSNISCYVALIVFCTSIQGSQRINLADFVDPQTSPLAPSSLELPTVPLQIFQILQILQIFQILQILLLLQILLQILQFLQILLQILQILQIFQILNQ